MARLPKAANAEGNEDTGGFTPLPPGDYTVEIIKSEEKENSKKTGAFLALQMKVIEGDFKGRMLFDNLNLWNPSTVAEEIASKKMNAICAAAGKRDVEDSEEVHGVPIGARVAIKPATAQYAEGNEIKAYFPADEVSSTPGDDDDWE